MSPTRPAPGIVDYPRGGLTERYVVREASIEQQFVIPEPLELGAKDLLILGEVESPGRFAAVGGGWRWGQGGRGVRLGDVRVYDAGGRELGAHFEVRATRTRLAVEAAELAAAAYPVTIDPEIAPDDFRISDMGPEGEPFFFAANPAVAYNSIHGEFLVVWQGRDLALGEDEIYGQRIDAVTGEELGENDFRISDMGPDGNFQFNAVDPAVAYNSFDDEYLVVWRGDDVVDSDLEIWGQRIDGATGEELGENDFRISDMGPEGDNDFSAFSPDVVYYPVANEYLVVWSGSDLQPAEFEIYGQRLDGPTGTELGENDFRISDMGPDGDITFEAERPAAVYNPTWDEYLVVWSGADVEAFQLQIHAQRLDAATGHEVGENDFRITDVPANQDAKVPAAAYNPTDDEYLVVYYAEDVDPNPEVHGQRLDGETGAEVGPDDFRISDMGPEGDGCTTLGGFLPDVVYDAAANEYLVVWYGVDECQQASGEAEIYGQRLDGATGAQVGANDFRLSRMGPGSDPSFDAFSPAVAYNPAAGESLVVWWGDQVVDDDTEIYGQRYAPGLFEDDFEDEEIDPAWALLRGAWSEAEGLLEGLPEPAGGQSLALAVTGGFAGCDRCRARAELEVRNPGAGGPAAALLLGWLEAPDTHVLVLLDTDADTVTFTQRVGGVVAQATAAAELDPDVFYTVNVAFEGSVFKVVLDGAVVIEEPNGAATEPFGRFALGARNADLAVEGFFVVAEEGG